MPEKRRRRLEVLAEHLRRCANARHPQAGGTYRYAVGAAIRGGRRLLGARGAR